MKIKLLLFNDSVCDVLKWNENQKQTSYSDTLRWHYRFTIVYIDVLST